MAEAPIGLSENFVSSGPFQPQEKNASPAPVERVGAVAKRSIIHTDRYDARAASGHLASSYAKRHRVDLDRDHPERLRQASSLMREVDDGAHVSLEASATAQLLAMPPPKIGVDIFNRLREVVLESRQAVIIQQHVLEQITSAGSIIQGSALMPQNELILRSAERKFANSCVCLKAVASVRHGDDPRVRQLVGPPDSREEEIVHLARVAEKNACLSIMKKEIENGTLGIDNYISRITLRLQEMGLKEMFKINPELHDPYSLWKKAFDLRFTYLRIFNEIQFAKMHQRTLKDIAMEITARKQQHSDDLEQAKIYDFFLQLLNKWQSEKRAEWSDAEALKQAKPLLAQALHNQDERLVQDWHESETKLTSLLSVREDTFPYVHRFKKAIQLMIVEKKAINFKFLATEPAKLLLSALSDPAFDNKGVVERILPFVRDAGNIMHALFERTDQIIGALHNRCEQKIQEMDRLPSQIRNDELKSIYKKKSAHFRKLIKEIEIFSRRLAHANFVPAVSEDDQLLRDFRHLTILEDGPAHASVLQKQPMADVATKG